MTERTPVRAAKKIEAPDNSARLDAIRTHVNKSVPESSMMRMNGPITVVPVISSGSLKLDRAIGIGGYPCGRIVEVFGPESSGKTTLTLHAIACAQANGGIAAFVDAEHALDPKYARALGVQLDDILITQPDNGEQALQQVDHLLDAGMLKQGDIIVVDSVAALTPKAEIEGEIGDAHVGLLARLMSQTLRMVTAKVAQTGVLLYFTNQERDRISTSGGYGPTKVTTGGNALKFYASVRVSIKRTGSVNASSAENALRVANKVQIDVVKNKMAPPFTRAETTIRFGEGISRFDELLDIGIDTKIIEVNGSWYSFGGERLAQGKENVITVLRSQPNVANRLEGEVRKVILPQ